MRDCSKAGLCACASYNSLGQLQASSFKLQAASCKLQAASFKLQASSKSKSKSHMQAAFACSLQL
ncbi:hypothetical protein, partial [Pseudomonas sp. UBA2311]|uniref:hypothetical protein n=1 Tax=Pseudomonas sp. UBA2311 TaxID=1947308 RepID=UPI00257AF72C